MQFLEMVFGYYVCSCALHAQLEDLDRKKNKKKTVPILS